MNPLLPVLDDYYEPFTYDYGNLFNAPAGKDQPTARPISLIDGKPMEIKSGPNWDDDLSGSPIYAAQDPNLAGLSDEERTELQGIERMVFFYLPRICNHCLNAACAAACPSGAIYKRGEDGIVLVNQDRCRGWRMCVSACPYKKVYFNWSTGKSEKCILCYPRLEAGEAPACFHTCVGASVTWAFCSTTRTGSPKRLGRPTRNWWLRSARSSSTRAIPRWWRLHGLTGSLMR